MIRWIGFLIFGLASVSHAGGSIQLKPHVVLFVSDDMGWNEVGYHGSTIATPHIDQLAREGVQLDRFYVHPVCSPTRTALMTGRIPARMGIFSVIGRAGGVPKEERFLPELFRQAGYQTAMSGKWHLGFAEAAYRPNARGFNQFFGFYGGGINYYSSTNTRRLGWFRNGRPVNVEGYSTDLLADEAISRIQKRDKNKPLLLYVPFNAPHPPAEAPEALVHKYRRLGYTGRRLGHAGAIEAMDAAIGRILVVLKKEGMERNTLVMFFCDNGSGISRRSPQYEPGQLRLRGGKGTLQEGGIRVPAVIRWPGVLQPNTTSRQLMGAQDLLPTLAAAAGFEPVDTRPLDGVNCWPAILKQKRMQRPPLIVGGEGGGFAVLQGNWKLIWDQHGLNLYDIEQDPIEAKDLSTDHPLTAAELADVLRPVREKIKQ
ncbi:MAG: arylsulfatase [Verrucomicrobiales bacterium]|nr:arylsulfatase [Verrucomicrobiales bacterium]